MTKALEDLEAIDKVIADYTAQRRALAVEVGHEVLKELVAPFFEYVGVSAVAWHQYTPGYCDGDPCTFSVGYPGVQFSNYDPEDEESNDGSPGYEEYGLKRLLEVDARDPVPSSYQNRPEVWYDYVADQEQKRKEFLNLGITEESLKDLVVLWNKFWDWMGNHEPFLQDAFGEPLEITFRADGTVEVDEYYVGY